MTTRWRYLNNNALHDFYSSAHSALNEGPQEMKQAWKKQNGGFH